MARLHLEGRGLAAARRLAPLAAVIAVVCSSPGAVAPATGLLSLGNWGGDSAAMIVGDTAMHLHVGCTFGDVSGRVQLDAAGHFDVQGSYTLRAFPIAVGPSVPAHFEGNVSTAQGGTAVIVVTINDTVTGQTVIHGPVTVALGQTPRLMPCPVCRRPIVTLGR